MTTDLTLYPITPEAQNALAVVEMALAGEHVTPQQIIDALATVPGGLPAAVTAAGAIVLNLEAKSNMLEDAINRLQGKKAVLDKLVQVSKEWALSQCQAAGVRRLSSNDGAFSAVVKKNPPRVEILNADELPAHYIKTELVDTPLKSEIKDALRAGQLVPGARLVQDERIEFR